MSELPRSVRIGPIDYTIELVPDLMLEKDGEVVYLNGHILLDEEKIVIDAGLSHRQAVVTLWHEIFHAILGQAGSEAAFDESIVRPLGYGLLDVAYNNPRLFETLRKPRQGDTGMDIAVTGVASYESLVAALDAIFGEQEGPVFTFESTPGSDAPMADLIGTRPSEFEPVELTIEIEPDIPSREEVKAFMDEAEETPEDWRLPFDAWTADTVCGARGDDPDPGQTEGELYSRNCPGCGGEPCGMIDWDSEPDELGCWDEEDAEHYDWDASGCNCWACRGQS